MSDPVQRLAADVHAPSSNTAAVVTYPADPGSAHVLRQAAWSYSGAPTAGNLKVEDGSGVTVFSVDVTAGGPGYVQFEPPLAGTPGKAMVVTLAAGGAGVSGKLSLCHTTQRG